ncbi:MAG: peptidogalycan biosysnthesis protein [Alphaproteobacteria bacterium]
MILKQITSIEDAKEFCQLNFRDSSPFLRYDFFKLLEDSECTNRYSGWIPSHFLIKEKDEIVGFIPNFKKLNSFGEYIFDHMFEHAYYQIGVEYFPKFLSGIPFTPVTKLKFIYSNKSINTINVLKLVENYLNEQKVSSFHVNFINESIANLLEENNFFKRIGIQYHWINKSFGNFKDFLDSMKSRKKKNIQKERDFLKDQKILFVHKKGNQIKKEDMINLFKCYMNTIDKKWSRAYLNINFFVGLIKTSALENMLLISAHKNGKLLGSSIHFIGDDTLYGRYWGCLEDIPYLHFELCYYQAIEYAIKNKLTKIEAGAQGEHKISRGYNPILTFSNHWFNNSTLKEPIRDYLQKENKKTIDAAKYLEKYSPFSINTD